MSTFCSSHLSDCAFRRICVREIVQFVGNRWRRNFPWRQSPAPVVNTSGRARAALLLLHPAALATNSRWGQMRVHPSRDDNSKLILAHNDSLIQLLLRCKVDVSVNMPNQPVTRSLRVLFRDGGASEESPVPKPFRRIAPNVESDVASAPADWISDPRTDANPRPA
jgi:hypothetical protein